MYHQSTRKISQLNQPFRAGVLLFLILCLLISCPVKRELKASFFQPVPAGSPSAPSPYPQQMVGHVSSADFELACTKVVHSILDEVDPNTFFQQFDLKSPAVYLALSLAGLYLLFLAATGNKTFHNAFPGGTMAAKIPLFLRYRQLVI